MINIIKISNYSIGQYKYNNISNRKYSIYIDSDGLLFFNYNESAESTPQFDLYINTEGEVLLKYYNDPNFYICNQIDDRHYSIPKHSNYYIILKEHIFRMAYKTFSGKEIPNGYCIHHLDCNHKNNKYDNLICLSRSDHSKLHILLNKKNNNAL